MAPSKTSKTKDTNKPKRPQTAFFLWMNANRDSIKKTVTKASDVAKAAGEQWRAMSDSEKSKWSEKADIEKQRYEKELAQYKDTLQKVKSK